MFIGSLFKIGNKGGEMRKIKVEEFNSLINFLIDTGADCVCLPKMRHLKLLKSIEIY